MMFDSDSEVNETMTEERESVDSEMIRVENADDWKRKRRQANAEDWYPVVRSGDTEIEARPVDRQDGIAEGEAVESTQWLVREANGDTYTVSDETFESEFEFGGSLSRTQFVLDLSWEDTTVEPDDDIEQEIVVAGPDVYVDVIGYVDDRMQTIERLDVIGVKYEWGENTDRDDYYYEGGFPSELVEDSPRIMIPEREED